jgi:hypothetical protein
VSITLPFRCTARVGTLSDILRDVASYIEMDKEELAKRLF